VGEPDLRTTELATASSPSSLRAETPEPEGAPSPTSLDTKAALSERLFLLSGVELGHVITLIEQQAPQALEDVVGTSHQVEIVMDALPPRTFAELDKYTRDKVGHRNGMDAGHASGPPLKKSKKSK
jgi:Bromodomain extra-terminal - transcription regulation